MDSARVVHYSTVRAARRIGIAYVWEARLRWYAARREVHERSRARAQGEASSRALTALLRDASANAPESPTDPRLAELAAITRAYGAELEGREGYPGVTPLSGPGFRAGGEVEGSTLHIQPGEPQTNAEPRGRGGLESSGGHLPYPASGRRGGAEASDAPPGCETAYAGCEEECAVADGGQERVLGRGVGGTEVRTGPRGERIERLPVFTREDELRARLDKTNRWRSARGLPPKAPWWTPSEGGPTHAKAPPESKPPPRAVVRRRKLADGTIEEAEITPRRKK